MHCAARKSATGHSPVEEADKYALTFYKFKNEGRMIEPSKKSRIYLSVCEEFKRKIEQGKPQKKLLTWTKKRGRITNVPSASHIPTINQN